MPHCQRKAIICCDAKIHRENSSIEERVVAGIMKHFFQVPNINHRSADRKEQTLLPL